MDFIKEFDEAISFMGSDDLFESLVKVSDDEIYELSQTLALISKYHFKPEKTNNERFSFIANSSLSGGQHPCSAAECRTKKLNQLTTFASLYADEVYIENPFENIMLRGRENVMTVDRQELFHGIRNYIQLKPLIKKGVIKYANNMVSLCQHHSESIAKPLADKIREKEEKLYKYLHKHILENCTFLFGLNKDLTPYLKVIGPEDFIDHGEIYFHFNKPYPSLITTLLTKQAPCKLSKNEVVDNNVLDIIINPILRDLSSQEWNTVFYNTSYLCDNPTQIKIVSKINSSAYAASSSAFEKGMKHYLPTIYTQNLQTVMDLREKEGEAFFVYRDKLSKLINESKSWSEKEVTSIFRDELLPEINLIDKKIKDWRSNSIETLKEKVIFGTGAVVVGLYSGVLPVNIGEIVAAIGGGSAVVGALMDYNKTFKEKEKARSNDFYFLWQARRE